MEEVNIASEIASGSVDFSFFTLFLRADWVVKSVIIVLILSSIYSWNIIVGKIIRINRLKKLDEEFDYSRLKVSELKSLAAAKKLEGYKSLKKGPLIELLKSSE